MSGGLPIRRASPDFREARLAHVWWDKEYCSAFAHVVRPCSHVGVRSNQSSLSRPRSAAHLTATAAQNEIELTGEVRKIKMTRISCPPSPPPGWGLGCSGRPGRGRLRYCLWRPVASAVGSTQPPHGHLDGPRPPPPFPRNVGSSRRRCAAFESHSDMATSRLRRRRRCGVLLLREQ